MRYWVAASLALLAAACGDGRESSDEATSSSSAKDLPVFRVYRVKGGERELMEFAPLSAEQKRSSAPANDRPDGSELQVTPPDVIPDFSQDALDPERRSSTWKLLEFAARECEREGWSYDLDINDLGLGATVWRSSAWYIYSEPAGSCDRVLLQQENLLCAADKLAEVAEGIGTVRWENAFDGEVIEIPAQGQTESIVVRELAFNALAHFARLGAKGALAWWRFGENPTTLRQTDAEEPSPPRSRAGASRGHRCMPRLKHRATPLDTRGVIT